MQNQTPFSQALDSLRSQFKVMQECPLCQKGFGKDQIKVVEQESASHVLHITCSQCQHSLIILVGMTEIGVGIVGLLSDLSLRDVHRFKNREPISEDDLLAHYETISFNHQKFNNLIIKNTNI